MAFLDPKGIRNLRGPDDPKIRFYETVKELQERLGDPNVLLSSFILSNTPLPQVSWWDGGMTKAEFEQRHVLFQTGDRDSYISAMLQRVLAME